MNLRKLLKVASVIEIIVGFSLIMIPSKVVYLLFGIDSSDIVTMLGCVAGIALLCLGIACLPGKGVEGNKFIIPAVVAMFTYNSLIAVYLLYIKIVTEFVGLFLMPTVVLHFIIAVSFVYLLLKKGKYS